MSERHCIPTDRETCLHRLLPLLVSLLCLMFLTNDVYAADIKVERVEPDEHANASGPDAEVQWKGLAPARTTREELKAADRPQRVALIIGIDQYTDKTFPGLRYAVRDAEALAEVLRDPRRGGFDRVYTLTAPERTRRTDLLTELRRISPNLYAKDALVVYFSGHGTLELNAEGKPQLYLVASDTKAQQLRTTGLEVDALREFLSELRPKRKVLILDNCFSGTGRSVLSPSTLQQLKQAPSPWDSIGNSFSQSEALLLASAPGGAAQEDERLQHGTYTYFLLQALTVERPKVDVNGDGAISIWEAHDYARAQVDAHTRGQQIPEAYFRLIGRSDVFLAGQPDPALEKATALVFAYGEASANHMQLLINGQSRGSFPRAIPVPVGRQQVEVKDGQGKAIAKGPIQFQPGQIYSAGLLLEELLGYRTLLGLSIGTSWQALGAAGSTWGPFSPRLELNVGMRSRGGRLRGLTYRAHVALLPAIAGTWTMVSDSTLRPIWELGAEAALRRRLGSLEWGVGAFASLDYTVGTTIRPDALSQATFADSHRWLSFPIGASLWAGIPLPSRPHLPPSRFTLALKPAWMRGDFRDVSSQDSNLTLSIQSGIELGF